MTTRRALAGIATAGIAALVLAGCGAPPEEGGSTQGAGGGATSDFLPCMVSDTGGFDDKSFNQAGKAGIDAAAEELGTEANAVRSDAETDYAPNIDNLIDEGCGIIVTVGFLLADATREAAEANPDVNFAIVDDASIELDNVKPITFNTSEAAFLAGYAAASFTKTGIVGTFGGIQIPTVTIFMDGFARGVEYHNAQKGTTVTVAGWDADAQTGSFTGGFEANDTAKQLAQGLIDQGADIIMPVGGPIFISAGEAIRDSGREVAMIGVDSDAYETAPEFADLFLTSVLKGVAAGVEDVVLAAGNDEFSAEPYVGTLENDGVGIAPFHDFEDAVSPDLQGELDAIVEGIIDGSITIESPSALS